MQYKQSIFMIIFFMLMSSGVQAAVSNQLQDNLQILHGKNGKKTAFVQWKKSDGTTQEKAVADKARTLNANAPHAGEIFYRNGIHNAKSRYVATGRIVVQFDTGDAKDPAAFAAEHGLKYIKSIGKHKTIAIFVNENSDNDITVSNALLKAPGVLSVQPDWVLPVKLF